jgi:hypothetical protein
MPFHKKAFVKAHKDFEPDPIGTVQKWFDSSLMQIKPDGA